MRPASHISEALCLQGDGETQLRRGFSGVNPGGLSTPNPKELPPSAKLPALCPAYSDL